jgi:hypothetical protein
MSRPTIKIHNIETNEEIIREMNDEEFSHYELIQVETAAHIAKEAEKATAKATLLAKLGITEDEARLLLS